jgi:hypothetical protein
MTKKYVIFSENEREHGVHGMNFENQGYWSEKLRAWSDLDSARIYTEWEATSHVIAFPYSLGYDAVFREAPTHLTESIARSKNKLEPAIE